MKVGDLMSAKVVKASPKERIKEAARRMAEAGISGVPVLDENGKLVGMLSEFDIVNAVRKRTKVLKMVYPSLSMVSVSFVEEDAQVEISKALHEVAEMKVQEIMHQKVLTVKPGDDLSVAVNMMNGNNVNRLPVIGDEGLVGILSRGDVVRGMFKGQK